MPGLTDQVQIQIQGYQLQLSEHKSDWRIRYVYEHEDINSGKKSVDYILTSAALLFIEQLFHGNSMRNDQRPRSIRNVGRLDENWPLTWYNYRNTDPNLKLIAKDNLRCQLIVLMSQGYGASFLLSYVSPA